MSDNSLSYVKNRGIKVKLTDGKYHEIRYNANLYAYLEYEFRVDIEHAFQSGSDWYSLQDFYLLRQPEEGGFYGKLEIIFKELYRNASREGRHKSWSE